VSSSDTILQRLAAISKSIEEHAAATFLLERERLELQQQLRALDWKPPGTSAQCPLELA
jgi:hypothetical protein